MPDLRELYRVAADARRWRDEARSTLRGDTLRLQTVEQELVQARRGSGREQGRQVAELERERERLNGAIVEGRRALNTNRERTIADIGRFFNDPSILVSQLADTSPFLLFPFRIETKFSTSGREPALLVRIFPDAIAIAHHEKELTVGEQDAGQTYWRARARANAESDGTPEGADAKEKTQRGAWNLLASRYGSYRASWIARATQPAGWSDTSTDPGTLAFPILVTKPVGWSETPRSPVMPDIFSVVLQRGQASRMVHGGFVPDDLPLGPDPLQAENFLTRDASGRLNISDDLRWLIDFERAVSVGMGIRIALTPDEAAQGFDRILVLGVRVSSDIATSGALLSHLIESHRYSQGMAIVPQGTPTNNTDDASSGLTTVAQSVDETYDLEHDAAPFPTSTEPMRQLDGERLANALGLPIEAVRALPNARAQDIAESVAMHRALWGGTLGHFLKEMLDGSFAAPDIASLRLFLTEFVHGRGLVPAIRVGSQPYGIVVTSAFDGWTWSDAETGDTDFWNRLQTQLGILREHWSSIAKTQVRFVGKKDATGKLLDPFETLIDVIGLQASSVEFWSRTAVPESYLKALARYRGNDPDLVNNWIANAKNNRTLELGNAKIPLTDTTRLKSLLFLEEIDLVTDPVIDGDPAVPLSETRRIRPYDGALGHNYLDWFATASSADIQDQRFAGADGKPVAPPAALLFKLLRVATLAELHTGSRLIAQRVLPDVFAAAPSALPDMPNVAAPSFQPGHFALLDTAKLGLTTQSMTTGDLLLGQARASTAVIQKAPEAAPLAAMTDAVSLLAQLPTARLERLLAEHLDVVSYRLDAWLTGMFGRRLARQRLMGRQRTGTYLGGYGWVEDVRPSKTRQPVNLQQIPEALHSAVEGPVVTYTDNGGFVHAPSLTHAVTAAVLRNAYLTHAERTATGQMSVNLSSARVRTALRYIEGLQNGQELGALLGYQLERGLHERHLGVELDGFIYVLRERFPLISKKLTATPEGVAAEVIEARNVINGYDLLDFVKDKSYPYGVAGLPNASADPVQVRQADAIRDEVDRLRDAMDGVADLLLAESVHQVVQGNYDRARGAIQALTDGEFPPMPEVIQTPRTGKALTHRVAVFLKPGATSGWNTTLTPRAAANAALNHWLTTVLPPPADIQWMVTAGTAAPQFVSLAALKLEPIDLVLMSGDRLGDLSSNLERLLVFDFRETHTIADDVATFFFEKTNPDVPIGKALIFNPDKAQPGKHSLGSLLPMLKALRRLVTASRALGARDLIRSTEAQHAHPENPQGYDGATPPLKNLADLKARIEAVRSALSTERTALSGILAAMTPLAQALEDDPSLAVQPAWTTIVPQFRTRLRSIVKFGVPEAMPSGASTISRSLAVELFAQAGGVDLILQKKLDESRALLDIAFVGPAVDAADEGRRVTARFNAYVDAAKRVLGSEFVPIPLFAPHAESVAELALAAGTPVETDPLVIESWLQSVSRVRPAMNAWDIVATYHQWLADGTFAFTPIQLPVTPAARWIGTAFGDTVKADDVVAIVAHDPPASVTTPMCGLLLDEWTELVPAAKETTGLAINVNRPNAVAPQAILLAVAPKQSGHWSLPDLVAVLNDTLDRAKIRAVEPDAIGYPYFHLLPPIVSAFDYTMLMATAKFAGAAAVAQKV